MSKILVVDGVVWLPIPVDSLERLSKSSRDDLGWKLEDFVARAQCQIEADSTIAAD